MDSLFQDGKKLWSQIWHKEELANKKRRWLTCSPAISTCEGNQKRSKKPKFLTNKSLSESYVRRDEVSSENLRKNIEKCFGSFSNTQGAHHVVKDYLQLFDIHNVEGSYSLNRSNLKNFLSVSNFLNNNALLLVSKLVTDNKVKFEKTRPKMKKIIREYLEKVCGDSNYEGNLKLLQKLSQICRDPSNYREKQLTLLTPVSSSLLSSIQTTLEGLDEMPIQDLVAMNRKLRGVKFVPQFPPIFKDKKGLLIDRVRRRCKKILSTLKEGDDLPKPLAKALSVMHLSLKHRLGCIDILTSEFYPFSPEMVALQNDILKAIWSLPKVKLDELKALQPLVDPEAKVPWKTFRIQLKKYLIEYLFECAEIEISEEVLSTLASINRRSRRRPILHSREIIEEETETVLNISSQLKQVVVELLPDARTDEKSFSACSEVIWSERGSEDDDFELVENEYGSNPDKHERQQTHGLFLNGEIEAVGDSRAVAKSAPISTIVCCSLHPAEADRNVGDFVKNAKVEQDADMNASLPHKNDLQETEDIREISIQEICDETSLVSYKLIGHILDKFLQIENRDIDAMTRYYLRGESSPHVDPQGAKLSSASKEDVASEILFQSAMELLPSLSESCIESVKKLMD